MTRLSQDPQDKMTRAAVRSVPCPDCGVNAGEKCVGSKGQKRTSSHAARWAAYRDVHAPAKPLTVRQVIGIVRRCDELDREVEAAERAIYHGGNEDTMRWKNEALERAKRERDEFMEELAHTVDPWWL